MSKCTAVHYASNVMGLKAGRDSKSSIFHTDRCKLLTDWRDRGIQYYCHYNIPHKLGTFNPKFCILKEIFPTRKEFGEEQFPRCYCTMQLMQSKELKLQYTRPKLKTTQPCIYAFRLARQGTHSLRTR